MAVKPFEPQTIIDAVYDFANGMNSGVAPLLLAKNQLAFAVNTTVRGTFAKPRPPYRKLTLNYAAAVDFKKNLWQGGCAYKPDSGTESLVAQIGGRLYKFLLGDTSATVTDETIAGDANPITQPQAWLWQAEKWVVVQDGKSRALFFDETASPTSRRSTYNAPVALNDTTAASFVVPEKGQSVNVTFTTGGAGVVVGDVVTIRQSGQYLVKVITASPTFTLVAVNAGPIGGTIAAGVPITWYHVGSELPPGRMGAYGLGRNWLSLVDGKQFLASDAVGGSSGTVANNYRDAVLQITENLYLSGGGNFTVPGTVGAIRAMRFATTLDKSLGQGSLQVFTPPVVFSCDAPTDRSTWQSVTDPILTESLIGNGGLGQHSTIGWNGDTMFRSIDGVRSLVLARRDFDTWGNTPITREVERVILKDNRDLLAYGSAVTFDNRFLFTASPQTHAQGVFHSTLIALNADPTSSLRGKAASVYDGAWTGLNILQLIISQSDTGNERCFAFTLNTAAGEIELYELLSGEAGTYDNDDVPILWSFETPVLLRVEKGKTQFDLCRLIDGEISVDSLIGAVSFEVSYKPDSYPCWIPWRKWTVCAKPASQTNQTEASYQPGFQPRMGLSEPDPKLCDDYTNRPFREAYFFEFKVIIRGYCRFLGMKVKAVTLPQPDFAPVVCETPC